MQYLFLYVFYLEVDEKTTCLASFFLPLVLNLGHSPLYWHFYKCLYIEMLKILLVY